MVIKKPVIRLGGTHSKKGQEVFSSAADRAKVAKFRDVSKSKVTDTFAGSSSKKKKKKKKTGIAAFREKPTLAGKAVKAATSLKTTAVLGTALAALAGVGAITAGGRAALAAGGGQIAVTRTALSGALTGRSLVTQRAIVGKAISPSSVSKIFHKVRPVAARFSTNKKSTSLTTSLLKKTVTTIKNPAFIVGAIGSYPFASFVKEEALQTLSIPIMKAIGSGDFETAATLTEEVDTMLENQDSILNLIPYANVINQLRQFFKAAGVANDAWKQIIESEGAVASGDVESGFAKERRETDEAARGREVENLAIDAEYFRLIREKRYDEADQLLQSQL